MGDPYRSASRNITNPGEKAYAITPADDTELSDHCRALYVGGAGDVSVKLIGDDTPVTFSGVVAGSLLPLRVKEVRATGTTATNIVGIY